MRKAEQFELQSLRDKAHAHWHFALEAAAQGLALHVAANDEVAKQQRAELQRLQAAAQRR